METEIYWGNCTLVHGAFTQRSRRYSAHHAHCNSFVSEPLSLTSWLHHNHRVLVIPQKIPTEPISNIPDEKCQSNYSVSCRLAEIGLQFLCTFSRSS